MGRSPRALLALPWNVTVHGARFGGALGPLFLVLVPPLALQRWSVPVRCLACGVAAYVAMWASPISSFQLRFLMPVVAPLALMAAAGHVTLERWATPSRLGRTVAAGAVIVLLALNLPPFIALHEADRAGWDGWLTHVLRAAPLPVVAGAESEERYLRREVASTGAWRAINARLRPDARVLTFSGGDNFYAARRRLAHDATVARPAVWSETDPAAAVRALQRLGVTHVLFDRRELLRPGG